jgi:hypothetical protein
VNSIFLPCSEMDSHSLKLVAAIHFRSIGRSVRAFLCSRDCRRHR